MTDNSPDPQMRWLMHRAFDSVEPAADPVPAARVAGARRLRRRGLRRFTVVTVLVALAVLLASIGGVGSPGGGRLGGVPMWSVWLVLAGLLAVAEIMSTHLVLIMCAGGAALATDAAGVGLPVAVQIAAFVVGSVGLVGLVRPAARRRLERSIPDVRTGIDALVGQRAMVVRQVDAWGGRVRLAGEDWSARAYDSTQVLAEGSLATVMEIRGAEALVWEVP